MGRLIRLPGDRNFGVISKRGGLASRNFDVDVISRVAKNEQFSRKSSKNEQFSRKERRFALTGNLDPLTLPSGKARAPLLVVTYTDFFLCFFFSFLQCRLATLGRHPWAK